MFPLASVPLISQRIHVNIPRRRNLRAVLECVSLNKSPLHRNVSPSAHICGWFQSLPVYQNRIFFLAPFLTHLLSIFCGDRLIGAFFLYCLPVSFSFPLLSFIFSRLFFGSYRTLFPESAPILPNANIPLSGNIFASSRPTISPILCVRCASRAIGTSNVSYKHGVTAGAEPSVSASAATRRSRPRPMGRGRNALRLIAALFDRGAGSGVGHSRGHIAHGDPFSSDNTRSDDDNDDDSSQKQSEAPRDEDLRSVKRRIIVLRRQPSHAPVRTMVGFRSRTGWEPLRGQKHNQDTVVAVAPMPQSDRYSLFGILDGHGAAGHLVSIAVAESIVDTLQILLKRKKFYHSMLSTTNNSANSDSSNSSYPAHMMLNRGVLASGTDAVASEEDPAEAAAQAACLAAYGDVAMALARAMVSADRKLLKPPPRGIECSMSGSTGVFVLLHGSTLYCANVGDSRAVLGREVQTSRAEHGTSFSHYACQDPNALRSLANTASTMADLDHDEMSLYGAAGYVSVPLSFDHVPTRSEEKARLIQGGARVEKWNVYDVGEERVWLPDARVPGLAVTRSFGDSILKPYGLLAVPEIYALPLSSADSFIVLGSDGVFDFITSAEVIATVARMRFHASPQEAAEALVKMACDRWIEDDSVIDDISAAVIYLDVSSPASREPVEPIMVPIPDAALRHRSMAVLSTGSASFADSNDQSVRTHGAQRPSDMLADRSESQGVPVQSKEHDNAGSDNDDGEKCDSNLGSRNTANDQDQSSDEAGKTDHGDSDSSNVKSVDGRKKDSEGRWHFPHLSLHHHKRKDNSKEQELSIATPQRNSDDEEGVVDSNDFDNADNRPDAGSASARPDSLPDDPSSRPFMSSRVRSSHSDQMVSF